MAWEERAEDGVYLRRRACIRMEDTAVVRENASSDTRLPGAAGVGVVDGGLCGSMVHLAARAPCLE